MNIGYMTNAFGEQVGTLEGVMSIKDSKFLTLADDKKVIEKIANIGYKNIEMFDGNLERFKDNPNELKEILAENKVSLLGVYVTANFIYEDAFPDELWHIKETAKLAKELGAKHIVLGGGAIRFDGIKDKDYYTLAKNLDIAKKEIEKHDLIASYHPHLGCMVENNDQINKLFSLTEINFCPDLAHLEAGGSDAFELVKKYKDRIKYVHLKDYKNGEFMPLGKGLIPIEDIISYLLDNNFNGDWLVEIDGYKGDPVEASKTSYEFLNKKTKIGG